MRSRSPDTGPPRALAQLRRLRDLRVEAAEAAVRARRDDCARAAAAVQARLGEIAVRRETVARHAAYTVSDGAPDLPLLSPQFSAYRAQVDEGLERSEYALMDDEAELEASQARLAAAQTAWRREASRRDGVDELLVRSRRAAALHVERLADHDADERAGGAPVVSR